jgi:uncharacterized protein YidB (DUF937 family)
MSTLGEITTKLGGQQGQEGGLASLDKMVSSSGGLQGLTSKLATSGLGQQVQSWVSHGQNQPVSGSQIKDAMDPVQVHAMAQRAGMSDDECCDHVAKALPDIVDQTTPEGQMPAPREDPFSKGIDAVKHLLKL